MPTSPKINEESRLVEFHERIVGVSVVTRVFLNLPTPRICVMGVEDDGTIQPISIFLNDLIDKVEIAKKLLPPL